MAGTFILVTCEYPPFPGGIGTYSGELAKAVADAGAEVIVVGPAYDGPAAPQPHGITHRLILRHHKIRPAAALKLLGILRRAPADAIILAADIRTVLLMSLLRPFHRRPYRAMVHGSEASKFRAGSLLFGLARRAYLTADLVAYNSEATGDIFRTQIGTPAHDVVSYLGVDPDWFLPPQGGFEHAELAALPDDVPVFCSVGRIEPRKGQRETIQALATARDRFGLPDPVYVIAGRAEDEAFAATVAQEARAHNLRTILTGRLSTDDIKRLYRRASAHLLFARALPGKIEGFGLVLLEAAAQGCPSIAASVGGIPEVLGDTGVLVGDNDVDGLARAVADHVADPSLRPVRGQAAMERAMRFSWRNCAAATVPELVSPAPLDSIAPASAAMPVA